MQSDVLSIVGELAAEVAHEIRNPLTTVKGFVQLYQKDNHSDEYTKLVLSELERIETITSELLFLGKPQAVQMECINVIELIINTLDLLTPQFRLNDITYKLNVENSPIFVIGEKNQLKQVFLHLMKSSIQAVNNGGEICIHLRNGSKGECIIIFQIHGEDILKELLTLLGTPLSTIKEKVSGLGIMNCQNIINQNNGRISFKSNLNEGTIIEIRLPLAG